MSDNLLRIGRRYASHLLSVANYRISSRSLSPKRFVIFGRGRSGSTALVSLLDSLPDVYCDGEILNKRVFFPFAHVLTKCASSGASIYGCKILSYQIKEVQPIKDRINFVKRLHDHGFQIIYLRRDNLVQHGLSNMRARVFGFHKTVADHSATGKMLVNVDELRKWMKGAENLIEYEKRLLEGVPHLSLTYENDLADEGSQIETVRQICEFLKINFHQPTCKFRKVSPTGLRDSVENYDELCSALKGTVYESFLQ